MHIFQGIYLDEKSNLYYHSQSEMSKSKQGIDITRKIQEKLLLSILSLQCNNQLRCYIFYCRADIFKCLYFPLA